MNLAIASCANKTTSPRLPTALWGSPESDDYNYHFKTFLHVPTASQSYSSTKARALATNVGNSTCKETRSSVASLAERTLEMWPRVSTSRLDEAV